jgi:hypothetical protein
VCDIYADREIADIPADVDGNVDFGGEDDLTLTSDKTWRINGRIYVGDGKTLNIDPCTLIIGTRKPNAGSLFIGRGGKINAVGTKDKPIVFSSDDFEFHPSAPWGGVVLLGKSVIGPNVGTALGDQEKLFEGMTDVRATFGGNDVHDSSGTLATSSPPTRRSMASPSEPSATAPRSITSWSSARWTIASSSSEERSTSTT